MNLSISIVTPSFNQAPFLPECLESILNQTYPAIEHLVYDPGSPDGSQDVIRRYPHATLYDEPDKGQSDAVSKGFLAAKGDIIGWLNSDDCYASNDVFAAIIERFNQPDAPDIVYGRGAYIDDHSQHLRDAYVNESPETLSWRLHKEVGILQPTLFLRRSVIDKIGILSEDLNFGMDYEYWIRATKAGLKFAFLPKVLAYGRYYEDNKTLGKRGESLQELCDIVKDNFGYGSVEWIRRYAEFKIEKFDGILANKTNRTVTNPKQIKVETKKLLEAYNGSYDTLKFLRDNRGKRPYNATVQAMEELGISLTHPFQEIPLDQKTAPYCYCHTVTERRWAFKRDWQEYELAKTQETFTELRSQRKHDTCIIVGNGPSLKETDFSLLKHQDVFITNYAFLNEELLGYAKYLGVVNYLVAEQGAHQFNLLKGVIKLFPYWLGYCINGGDDTFFFTSMGKPEFSKDMFENVSWRSTVSFFQMQIAYSLGYRRVLMIGFDHNYSQDVTAKEGDILLCDQDDENHFDPRYFKGKRWQAADVNNMEAMYVLANQAFEADGREIINCTVGGKLELFERGNLEDYLGEAALKVEGQQRLKQLENIHQGKRCVIVGNDYNLANTDLSLLQSEICFGTNLDLLQLAQQNNFKFEYLTAIDKDLAENNLTYLTNLSGVKFVSNSHFGKLPSQKDIVFLETTPQDEFNSKFHSSLQIGTNASYAAIQLAYYMGFQEVILLGVKTTHNSDCDRYFRTAAIEFQCQNRQIVEAKLDHTTSLFPQQDYHQLFFSKRATEQGMIETIYLDHFSPSQKDKTFIGATIFTIPQSFNGDQGIIQRNAILSWKALNPNLEVILFGSAEEVNTIAQELDLIHFPQIEQMGPEMLAKVREIAKFPIVAYLHSTTILTPIFSQAVGRACNKFDKFLITGKCWDIQINHALDSLVTPQQHLEKVIADHGCLSSSNTESYLIFSRQLLENIDSQAIDSSKENLVLQQARTLNFDCIDASLINIGVRQSCKSTITTQQVESNLETITHQFKPASSQYAPKVTVIIVTYNQSANINRAIESVLTQTATDYEIIVIDDGSVDDTRQVIQPYENCLKYIYQDHQGRLNANNRGLWLAQGELIYFLDADDYLPFNSLQQQIDCFNRSPALDILISAIKLSSGVTKPWLDLPDLDEDLHIWKLWKLWRPLTDSIIMFRRDRLQSIQGFNPQLHSDTAAVDLLVRLITWRGGRAEWLQQSTCISHRQTEMQIKEPVRLARDFELVLNNFFAYPHLKEWIKQLKPIARYNSLIWLAWLTSIEDHNLRQNEYLRHSLSYTSNSNQEIIANWVTRFSKFSQDFDYDLPSGDLDTLQNLLP